MRLRTTALDTAMINDDDDDRPLHSCAEYDLLANPDVHRQRPLPVIIYLYTKGQFGSPRSIILYILLYTHS